MVRKRIGPTGEILDIGGGIPASGGGKRDYPGNFRLKQKVPTGWEMEAILDKRGQGKIPNLPAWPTSQKKKKSIF